MLHDILLRRIQSLSGIILFFSVFIILINFFIYQFPGNNFFPDNVLGLALLLILFNLGTNLYFKKNSKPCKISRELIYFFCIMVVVVIATNAVQLTPFPPIDQHIMTMEKKLHINMEAIMLWTNSHPQFKNILNWVYDSLPYQMSGLPILVILSCRFHLIREYYFLLLCTTLLGFGFYYFFPTAAPASVMNHSLFAEDQIATGLKFWQIHHYIQPTTNAGGLIALPSFHVIWAVLCVGLIREWIVPCVLLGLMNLLLIVSCVLLGWHYCTDVVGSVVVLLLSYWVLIRALKPES